MSGDSGQQSRTRTVGNTEPVRVDLRDVMKEAREIILVHKGQNYRLRVTSNEKLILTK